MPRMTRAKAAQVAEHLHVDEDAVLEMSGRESGGVELMNSTLSRDPSARKPLGEITPNSGEKKSEEDESTPKDDDEQHRSQHKTSAQSKKSERKAKRGKDAASATASPTSAPEIVEDAPETIVNDILVTEPSTSTMGVREEEVEHMRMRATASKSFPEALGRSTRSRTAKQADAHSPSNAEPKSSVTQDDYFQQLLDAPIENSETQFQRNQTRDIVGSTAESIGKTVLDAPASPLPSAMPNVISKLRNDAAGQRSTSNKENMEPLEASPPTTPAISVSYRGNRGIGSPVMDASPVAEVTARTPGSPSTYDALEIAAIKAATPSSTPRRTSNLSSSNAIDAMDALEDAVEKINAELPSASVISQGLKIKKKEAPVVRMTKGAQARISLVQGTAKPTPSWGPPRRSTLGRSQSVRSGAPSGRRHDISSSDESDAGGSSKKREVVIPHSKPRPMSVSFPPPKPRVKSSKAPTKSTFQLPGEAVAAKLKAAREERAEKEAVARKTFKARPAPVSSKVAPFVRETNASKFRQSLMNAKTVQPSGHRRANSVAPPQPRPTSRVIPATSTSHKLGSGVLSVNKRPSTAMANIGATRAASGSSVSANTTTTQRVPSKGTMKGKEVFNRAAAAKEALEKEKREKEEATKKARAAAAERSRQASREWARKQEMKKAGIKEAAAATVDAQAA